MTSILVLSQPNPYHGIPQIRPPHPVYTRWRHAHRLCPHKDTHHLVAKHLSNATTKYFIYCTTCDSPVSSSLPHALLADINLETVPVISDRSDSRPPCERCGRIGVEIHHWAPRALFDDADCWPTSYLCPECHRRWHRTINQKGTG